MTDTNKFDKNGRYVGEIDIHNNSKIDNSKSFRTFLSGLIGYTLEDEFPSRVHFFVIKNDNSKLTDANQILDIYLPIIPPTYDTSNDSSMSSFVKNGPNFPDTPSDVIEKRADKQIDRLITYLTFELANRYIKARKSGDKVIMNQIRNLSIMQEEDFNFELYEIARDYQTKLTPTKKGYCLTSPNLEPFELSSDQARQYSFYKENLERHPSKKDSSGKAQTRIMVRISELLGKLNEYNKYPLTHSQNENRYGYSEKNRILSDGNIIEDRRPPIQPGDN